jgi:hypothetical protein
MKFAGIFNLQSSILVSLLSGVGLLAVIAIAPVQDDSVMKGNFQEDPDPGFYNEIKKRESRETNQFKQAKESSQVFQLRITPKDLESYTRQLNQSEMNWSYSGRSSSQILNISNFKSNRYFVGSNDPRTKMFQYNNGDVKLNLSMDYSTDNFSFNRPIYNTDFRFNDIRSNNSNQIRNMELGFAINRSLSAVVTTSSRDVFDDRQRDAEAKNYALAGINLSAGNSISTRLVAGDTSFQINRNQNQLNSFRSSNGNNFVDVGISEKDRISQRTFEWQTNFRPSKSVMVQTAVFNNASNANSISNSSNGTTLDSGRMSVFFGKKNVILNVKYDYKLNSTDLRSVMSQWEPKQDAASLGFIVFLDPAQKYSLYLGGNQYNIANQNGLIRNNTSDAKTPPSFTASIRGKTNDGSKSNFFLNFQNQPPGMMGVGYLNSSVAPLNPGTNSKSFYEYATTLGMEVNF